MDAHGTESGDKVVDSSYYMLFYIAPIVNNMSVGKMLKWPELQYFNQIFSNWTKVPVNLIPFCSPLGEFLETAQLTLAQKLMNFAEEHHKPAFFESKTSIFAVQNPRDETLKWLEFLETELIENEEFDQVAEDDVIQHIQMIADELQIEEELDIQMAQHLWSEYEDGKWNHKDLKQDVEEMEEVKEDDPKDEAMFQTPLKEQASKGRFDQENVNFVPMTMEEKLKNQLYAEYLCSQKAKSICMKKPEETLNKQEWMKWWWNKNIRLNNDQTENRSADAQELRLKLLETNLVTIVPFKKAFKEMQKLMMRRIKIPKAKFTTDMDLNATIPEKPKNPWYLSKMRRKWLNSMEFECNDD